MNIASDIYIWTGGCDFESNLSFLLNPTFVNWGFTSLLFFPPCFGLSEFNMAKLTKEVVKFLQVPLHKAWFGWCSALSGAVTIILQGLRPAELTKG